METSNDNKVFYEAVWFGDNKEENPIIKGVDKEKIIESLLEYTKGKSRCIEVYKIEYNNFGHKIGLVEKFSVLDEIQLK